MNATMIRAQLSAFAEGLIELGNVVLGASVVAALFAEKGKGPWGEGYVMLVGAGFGALLGFALYATALNIIGVTGKE